MIKNIAKPFVKWVGGKTQLLNQIDNLIPSNIKLSNDTVYIEPFVGGGAVLFFILQKYTNVMKAYINDINFDDDYIALSHSPIQFFYKISNAYSDTLSTLSYEEYDKEKSAYQFIDDQKEDIQIIKE